MDSTAPRPGESSVSPATAAAGTATAAAVRREPRVLRVREHTAEIVSDSGEGAQKCGQILGAVSAKMGNGVGTVEIIPAEIQPPARTPPGGSGIRVRIGADVVTNGGDDAQLVVAFNEQVLLGRHRAGAIAEDAVVLLDDVWARHEDADVRKEWADGLRELSARPYRLVFVPFEEETLKHAESARRGKNMFALGVLCWIYDRDLVRVREQIAQQFRGKKDAIEKNVALFQAGHAWADAHLDFRVSVPATPTPTAMVVTNGNEALGMGAMAAGMTLCAMYPITPATSVSHYLAEAFERTGGLPTRPRTRSPPSAWRSARPTPGRRRSRSRRARASRSRPSSWASR